MPEYPVMFTFRDVVSGDGFLAGVTVYGRAIILNEDGKWWTYGVRPSAIAGSADAPLESFNDFRNRYRLTLFDFAEEACGDFEAFKRRVEDFYSQPDSEEESRWMHALHAIRHKQIEVEEPLSSLPRLSPEHAPTGVSVAALHRTKRFTSADNVVDQLAFAAAA